MGIQKYRADKEGQADSNKAIPWYTSWVGGPSLALIRNCPVHTKDGTIISPRTVYIQGEADTYFSQPAAISYKRKTIHGYITQENGNYLFYATDCFLRKKHTERTK